MQKLYLKILFLILTFVSASCFSGRSQEKIKLWGDSPPSRLMRFSELHVYRADSAKNTGVAVIVCPGGSYCYLGMKTEGDGVARWLSAQGINAFVLRYRLGLWGNHHPAMIQDMQQAIVWVRQHAQQYGIRKVGAMGFSAGGHLVGTAAIYYDRNFMEPLGIKPSVSLKPDFVAMVYPVVTMEDSLVHYKSRLNLLGEYPTRELIHEMSLEQQVHAGMPPVFVVACRNDGTVKYRNSVVFCRAMQRQNLPCEFHLYTKGSHGGHGFGADDAKSGSEAMQWKEQFLQWLKRNIIITYNNE